MAKQIFDIDTVGFSRQTLGNFYEFHINNSFYLMAPEYYREFYTIYLNRCISAYDGWMSGWHNRESGLVPQRMLSSVASGLNNMVFANGIDFSGRDASYNFITNWAESVRFLNTLKKAHKFAISGGTSLLKINRQDQKLFVSAHRIDNFFVDVDPMGNIVSGTIFFDAIHNFNPSLKTEKHFGIAERRYFNDKGQPCTTSVVYEVNGNLQTEVTSRMEYGSKSVHWEQLPKNVRRHIKKSHPSIIIGEEQYLPFSNSLGLEIIKFTDDLPQLPNLPLGQPIGDILWTENFQYDQIKYFEKNEVDLARARVLMPEQMWNKNDPHYESRALDQRFYQMVESNLDNDKPLPIQFDLRAEDIRKQKENILKDIAFKLNVSSSSIASFLSEGAGAKTATEIVNEKTKTDTWIKNQIHLISPSINKILKDVLYFYNRDSVQIVFKVEDQSPFIERLKTNSDVFAVGNMSAKRFVKDTYRNLSQSEQEEEIASLEESRRLRQELQEATVDSWQVNE